MTDNMPPVVMALWLGILTSISPCPMAGNIAAVSYVTGAASGAARTRIWGGGLLYALGRITAYVVLSALLAWGALSVPTVARFLQTHMNRLVGPLLILTGAAVLGWIRLPVAGMAPRFRLEAAVERLGLLGAAPLGFFFALSFCPISAALFFGSLLPLALGHQSVLLLPIAYGLGTALPVIAVAGALVLGVQAAGRLFSATRVLDRWARRVTGAVLLGVGGYFIWTYLLRPS